MASFVTIPRFGASVRRKKKLLIAATACALPLLAMAAGTVHADTVTTISSLSGFRQMVADTSVSPGYMFMAGSGGVLVTDLAGNPVATLDSGDTVKGLALSPDGSTLYAAMSAGTHAGTIAAVTVSTVTASPPTQNLFQLGTGNVPASLAVQSGKLWVSYDDGAATDPGTIGDVDLTTGTFEPQSTQSTWLAPPDLAADPIGTGVLVAVLPGATPAMAETFNTTGQVAPLAARAGLGAGASQCSDEDQLAVLPGGTEFIAACRTPRNEYSYSTTDLSAAPNPLGSGSSFPGGVAVGANGLVAVGTYGSPSAIYVYNSAGALLNVFTIANPSSLVQMNGLAWEDTAGGPQLAAMLAPVSGPATYSLDVIDQPTVTQSTLILTAPTTAVVGSPIRLAGSLSLSNGAALPADASTAVAITRTGPDGTTQAGTVTPGSDGSFTLTDPATPTTPGTYTYTASYGGDLSITTPSTAKASVTVSLNAAAITLSGPSTANAGKTVTLNGTLTIGGSAAPAGTKLTVARIVSGSTTSKQLQASIAAGGTFKLTDTPTSAGVYTYTVSYPGDSTTAPASATHRVSVVRAPTSLALATGSANVSFNATIHVTARLGTTFKNRTVAIYAQTFGSKAKKLLKTGTVNSSGVLTVSYKAPHSTTFSAVFTGDPEFAPKTVTHAVVVRARVSESVAGFYSTRQVGGVLYRLFHSSAVLGDTGTVAPAKPGECVQFEVQEHFQGAWQPSVKTGCVGLSKSSQARQNFRLNLADIGFPYRIRVDYIRKASDTTNVNADSGWFYFMVEK